MDKDEAQLRALGYKILEPVACGNAGQSREGLLLERSSKLQSDRQQGGDATTSGGVLYIKCTGTCCADRPLELHSAGGCIYSGNAFEAHAGRSYRKKWRETIRVLPHNMSLKTWLTQCGRVDRGSDSGGRREPATKEELLEAAVAAVAAAAAAVDSADFAPQAIAAQPAYSPAWPRQQDTVLGQQQEQPGQQEQWQSAAAAAVAGQGSAPGSTPGAAAESPGYPSGMANVGLLHLGMEQRQEEAPEGVPDGTRALIQQLGIQIRSQQPQPQPQKEGHEEDGAVAGSEQATPLLHAITALLGPAAQQQQRMLMQEQEQQHEQQRQEQQQQQQQTDQIEQLGAALFALAQQQREQLRQQQEHMHAQHQQLAQLQEQVQQQAAQHRKLMVVVSALGTAVGSLGGGDRHMPDGTRDIQPIAQQVSPPQQVPPQPQQQQQQQQQQPPIAGSNSLQGTAQAEAGSAGEGDTASLRRLQQLQQLVQLFRGATPPAPTPAPNGHNGGGAGQLRGASTAAGAGAAAATAPDGGGGRKRPRDHEDNGVNGAVDGSGGR